MSPFPDIPLEPINREAARLLNGHTPAAAEPVERFVADVQAKLEEIDSALASIKRQLLGRRGDLKWRKAATHAQAKYWQQKSSITLMLKTARSILHVVNEERARSFKENSRKQAQASSAKTTLNIVAEKNARKLRNIALANSQDRQVLIELKKLLKAEIGMERYIALMQKAEQHAKEHHTP